MSMPPEGEASPQGARLAPGDADAERFVFGADPVRERWMGRPLAETRVWLEFARLLADPVSTRMSMGADRQALLGASEPTRFAVDIARRVVQGSGRARREGRLTGHCGCSFTRDDARPSPHGRCRPTSLYSKGAGVVHW